MVLCVIAFVAVYVFFALREQNNTVEISKNSMKEDSIIEENIIEMKEEPHYISELRNYYNSKNPEYVKNAYFVDLTGDLCDEMVMISNWVAEDEWYEYINGCKVSVVTYQDDKIITVYEESFYFNGVGTYPIKEYCLVENEGKTRLLSYTYKWDIENEEEVIYDEEHMCLVWESNKEAKMQNIDENTYRELRECGIIVTTSRTFFKSLCYE